MLGLLKFLLSINYSELLLYVDNSKLYQSVANDTDHLNMASDTVSDENGFLMVNLG